MSDKRWERVKELVDEALERDACERDRFLGDACGPDKTLRQEVESLLSHEDESFLERSADAHRWRRR